MWSWTSPNIAKPSPICFQATSLLHIGQTGFGWPRSVPSRLWPWMLVQSTRELSHAGGIATSKFAGVICLSSVCSKSWGMGCSKVVGAWLLVSIQFSMYLQPHVRQRGGCHFLNPPKKEACEAAEHDEATTLPETNIAPENWPLEKEIPIENHHF